MEKGRVAAVLGLGESGRWRAEALILLPLKNSQPKLGERVEERRRGVLLSRAHGRELGPQASNLDLAKLEHLPLLRSLDDDDDQTGQ